MVWFGEKRAAFEGGVSEGDLISCPFPFFLSCFLRCEALEVQCFLCRGRALRAAWAWCGRAGFAGGGIFSRRGGGLVGGRARLALGEEGKRGSLCRLPAAFPCL